MLELQSMKKMAICAVLTVGIATAGLVAMPNYKVSAETAVTSGTSAIAETSQTHKDKWVTIEGKEYYYDAQGKLAKSRWVGDFYVDSKGEKYDIKLQLSSGQVDKGQAIKATVLPKGVKTSLITYTSSNAKVAKIEKTGKLVPIKTGTTTITAKVNSKIKETIKVTVLDSKTSTQTIDVDDNHVLVFMSKSEKETVKTWKSKDSTVLKVANNIATGVSVGTTKLLGITSTGKMVTTTVKVKKPEIEANKIELSTTQMKLDLSETTVPQLIATVYPLDATDKKITYASDNKKVATVDDKGNITPISTGRAVITATSGKVKSACDVYIYEKNVKIDDGIYTITAYNRDFTLASKEENDAQNIFLSKVQGLVEQPKYHVIKNQNDTYSIAPTSDPFKSVMVDRGETMDEPINVGDNVVIWKNTDPEASEWVLTKLYDDSYIFTLAGYENGAMKAEVKDNDKDANVLFDEFNPADQSQVWTLKKAENADFAGGNGGSDENEVIDGEIDYGTVMGTNTEPDLYSKYYSQDYNIFSRINLFGQCTWYAAGRAYEVSGNPVPMINGAHTWLDVAKANGYKTGTKPKANSIAVWKKSTYGHVAFVEAVDGDKVTITESNWSRSTSQKKSAIEEGIYHYEGYTTLTADAMKDRYGYILEGYVYLN